MNVGKSRYGQTIRPRFRGTQAVSGRPHWPQGYNQILEEVGIPEKHRPFHLRWVRQFLSRNKGRDWLKLREPEIRAYLEHLQEMPGIEGWQVQQALDAMLVL
jgi:hypothetical protein